VLAEHRRRGYATEILRQSLVVARAVGVQRVLICCDDDNVGSRSVMETCGGVCDSVVDNGAGDPAARPYPVPLKAQSSDAIGKIGAVGLLDDAIVCVLELKAPAARGDSPLRALLEGLSYAVVVDANREDFDAELHQRHPEVFRAIASWCSSSVRRRGGPHGGHARPRVPGLLRSTGCVATSRVGSTSQSRARHSTTSTCPIWCSA
jgi:hypothetical protein